MQNKFEDSFSPYSIPTLEYGARLPDFKIRPELKSRYSLKTDDQITELFEKLIEEGWKKKIEGKVSNIKEYEDRVKSEFEVFKELGFVGYLLITWGLVDYCRNNNIGVGPGRGSAAGSLILYLIGVTEIDSLKHGCYFERFLNKTRAKFTIIDGVKYYDGSLLLDIDLDISDSDRHLLVEYLNKEYDGQVARIVTLTTLSTKILFKEIVKTYLNFSEEDANKVSKSIESPGGKLWTPNEAYKESVLFKTCCDQHPEILPIINGLLDLNKNFGVHASAFVITHGSIKDTFPLQLDKDKNLITGYCLQDSLNISAKVDLLGLAAVALVDRVCKRLSIDKSEIDVNDPEIYRSLQHLETPYGLFQIEANTIYGVTQKVKPRNLSQLSDVLAIGRPGALQFIDQLAIFVATKNYKRYDEYLDVVLKKTGGACLYQETLLQIGNEIFGLSLINCEGIRKGVGKKDIDLINSYKELIYNQAKKLNLPEETANNYWKLLVDSAKYSFNRGHSIAYATLSATTVYLKFKYPLEFFLTLLEMAKDEAGQQKVVGKIQGELKHFGIKLLPPSLTKSDVDFKIEDGNIRFGLGAIKGISEASIAKLAMFKNEHANKFQIFKAADEAKVGKAILKNLIRVGSLDDQLNLGRSRLVLECEAWHILSDREKVLALQHGEQYQYELLTLMRDLWEKLKDEKGKFLIKESRKNTIEKHFLPFKQIYKQSVKNKELWDLNSYIFEKDLLGYSFTQTLQEMFSSKLKEDLQTIEETIGLKKYTKVKFAGEVMFAYASTSKKDGKPYIKYVVKDDTSETDVMIFKDSVEMHRELHGGLIQVGQVVIVEAATLNTGVMAESMEVQKMMIWKKPSDIIHEETEEEVEDN